MVLRRDPGAWTNTIGIWCDEAGKIVNSADAFYLTESRKFGGFSVFMAQSMKNFAAALPGDRGRAQAEMLLGCFAHKIIHALACPDTSEWASRLCGRQIRISKQYNPQRRADASLWELLRHGYDYTVSGAEHVENVLEAKAFMHNLRTGGPSNNLIAECIVLRSGEPFSTGENYLITSFSQE
jgi:hypothetical protein